MDKGKQLATFRRRLERKLRKPKKVILIPDDWLQIRESVISRDKVCIDCLMPGDAIHHLNGNKEDNNLENLVYLCHLCHLKRHQGKILKQGGNAGEGMG